MADHHGGPFPDKDADPKRKRMLDDLLNSAAQFRGATGDFPQGAMRPTDEGAIQFAIGVEKGKVVLDFGTPVAWVGMPAAQAAELGSLMIKHARRAARETGEVITVTL
jgi:hypothetical protein